MSLTDAEKIDAAEAEARKRRQKLLQRKNKLLGNGDDTAEDQKENKTDDAPSVSSDTVPERQRSQPESDELDLSNLAPRKVDWDLKRGIAKSLEILQDRTSEVIAEILRERSEIQEEVDD